jgi:phosphohistidine phosphatase
MLTLTLLRHGKSNWDDDSLDDFERPLAKRGLKAASDVGRQLAKLGPLPDLILCSTAVRTRATLSLVLAEWDAPAPDIRYDDSLYLALPETILEEVQRQGGENSHVMVVGHNPGLHGLALTLTGSGNRKDIQTMAAKFPTAAVARLTLPCDRWTEVRPGTGMLAAYMTPDKSD